MLNDIPYVWLVVLILTGVVSITFGFCAGLVAAWRRQERRDGLR